MVRPERRLDPTDGPVERFVADLRDLRRAAGSPSYRELGRKAHYAPTTFSAAVSGYRLPTLEVTLAFVSACDGDVGLWEERWRLADSQVRTAATRSAEGKGPAPYRGLSPYQPHHAEWFFGRDRLIHRLAVMLAVRRVVVVSGPSGSGKSSLLRAGVVPRLGRPAILVTPGRRPGAELATRLARLAERLPTGGAVTVVVDQFEELFTRGVEAAEQAAFVGALRSLAQAPHGGTRVVVGVRSDYGERAAGLLDGAANGVGRISVDDMTGPEIKESIVRAARHAGLSLERALVTRITAGALSASNPLPRISHALLEAWRRRRGVVITLSGYEAAGGIAGAVEQTAESVYAGLDAAERQALRGVLRRLVRLDSAGNVTLLDGAPAAGDPAATLALAHMVSAGLLTSTQETVRVAHEALVATWPRLRAWLRPEVPGQRGALSHIGHLPNLCRQAL